MFKNKIILAITLLLAGGFLITTLASYFVSTQAIKQAIIHNELPLTSDSIYSEIQRDILKPIFISSQMASDTFLRDWVIAGENDPDKIIRYLREIKNSYNTFTSFFVSENTRTYYQSEGILKQVNANDPEDKWFFRVRKMKTPYETNVDPDMANDGSITIFINYKVFDYKGNFIGTTGVGLKVNNVRKVLENYQVKFGRQIYFVDAQGDIRLHGNDFNHTIDNINEIPELAALSEQLFSQGQAGIEYQYNSTTYLLMSRFIPELNWYLIAEVSTDEAYAKVRRVLITNLIISFIVMCIVVLIANYTLNRYQNKLEHLATTDDLTGALTRKAFKNAFEHILLRQQRTLEPLAVILFDIDDFKKINDQYGHLAGDHVLIGICTTVNDVLRASDIFCRWGEKSSWFCLRVVTIRPPLALQKKSAWPLQQ